MKKLQASIKEATEGFDETLIKLVERKVKSEMVISQVSQHTHTCTVHARNLWQSMVILIKPFFDFVMTIQCKTSVTYMSSRL